MNARKKQILTFFLFSFEKLFDEGGSAVQIIIILRVCRVARVIRLAKRAESTKALLRTLLLALPAVANVAGLFLLCVYIFSIVGMHMFGKLKTDGNFFNGHANFQNVGNGMFVSSIHTSTTTTTDTYVPFEFLIFEFLNFLIFGYCYHCYYIVIRDVNIVSMCHG